MNNRKTSKSDENESNESSSSPLEIRNLHMNDSFLHYEIKKDKYTEFLNK
jgi:hypothetical protein